jgi:Flp pilus assembly CpaF family ATPase/cellulose biosynthesis protein BcsQ
MKHIITFLNRKGGMGKTTLALNLAAVFAAELKLNTAFLDYSESAYDTEIILDAGGGYRFDESRPLADYMLKKENFFLFWAGAPGLTRLIEKINDKTDILIVDTNGLPPEHLLEISDKLFIPGILNPLDIKFSNYTAQWLLSMNYPASLVEYLVNKNTSRIFSLEDIQEVMKKIKVKAAFNYEKEIEDCAAKGELYYLKNKKSDFITNLKKLAEEIANNAGTKDHLGIIRNMKIDVKQQVLQSCLPAAAEGETAIPRERKSNKKGGELKDKYSGLKKQVHELLFDEIDIKNLEKDALTHPDKKARIHGEVKTKIRSILDKIDGSPTNRDEREVFIKDVFNEVAGYGAIEDMLANPDITEIMVNKHDEIYVEKGGKLALAGKTFTDDRTVLRAIERIVMPLGRRIDESMPYVDARLPDGSRVNAIIPPLAIDGPVLTIRKFSHKKLTFNDLMNFGSITQEAVDYLREAVVKRKNMLISGGTGSGKTTLLNVLSSFIPEDERIVTIEDSAELRLPQDHVVRLEARLANIEGKGEVTIRDLVRNALRMRPDRIIVGECRGGETLDMLQAMNTGHEGSMTTVHANSPRDALSRLDVLVLMSGAELPLRAIREQVKSALDIIIQQSRFKDGSRKITHISEITGMEGDTILSHNVFEYGKDGLVRADRV